MDIEAFKMALSDVQAPICNRIMHDQELCKMYTDTNVRGVDGISFRSFIKAVGEADDIEQYLGNENLSIMADSLRPHLKYDNQLSQFAKLENGILRVAAEETADRLLFRLKEPYSRMQDLMKCEVRQLGNTNTKYFMKRMARGPPEYFHRSPQTRIGKCAFLCSACLLVDSCIWQDYPIWTLERVCGQSTAVLAGMTTSFMQVITELLRRPHRSGFMLWVTTTASACLVLTWAMAAESFPFKSFFAQKPP
jgi:hypothetical protein